MLITRTLKTFAVICLLTTSAFAQSKSDNTDKFRQLEEILPTPNTYRAASGAPGHQYWQQRADYQIKVTLDDARQRITGSETITYYNNSPDTLAYIWLQLDQNIFAKASGSNLTQAAPGSLERVPFTTIDNLIARRDFDGGNNITSVREAAAGRGNRNQTQAGAPLRYTIVDTMMRIELPRPLASGQTFSFAVDWNYNINDQRKLGGRTGYEFFPADGNYIYEIAHWFPRMAAYTEVNGWQHKQFLGSGEFTLEFGNYRVEITAPADHVVAATGVLQNANQILTAAQRQRLEQSRTATTPVLIVTPDEARAAEADGANKTRRAAPQTKTWIYEAENVRDFAFASSRKFIWDAQGHNVEGNRVLAMSYYPKEGNPLWERFSTQSIIHTLNVYSRYSFRYPYPIAISVNGPVGGMEYPMICFNGPRPQPDGTYSAQTKYGLISVIIHEVGHNYFPMIVNSDERQWTWMDEGLNTFLQYLAEQEWEPNYPSRRGEPQNIVEYMASNEQVPIMTNSESLLQFGNNAYAKPATALNILRETILGRAAFDYAFKTYAQRWQFKRPEPADFFRTMEDASGTDLDWFWRGWFYTTDHTDIALENIRLFRIDSRNPDIEEPLLRQEREARPTTLGQERNRALPKRTDQFPTLRDFYNSYDELEVTQQDRDAYQQFLQGLTPRERELLNLGMNFYIMDFKNIGGLVMPIILRVEYTDNSSEIITIPAEIWRYNNREVSKMLMTPKEIRTVTLDPRLETADVDLSNNFFPQRPVRSRFQLFKQQPNVPNPMQRLERKQPESAQPVTQPTQAAPVQQGTPPATTATPAPTTTRP
ncbi:MAG: M1 family metallopeptidase [Pyrinomonadaceae bacterium MAG19_C2-C3]|nr:M1 family metallopeptidase [Pyrinomonadaceae bacterium MAG19_C2-C3]